MIEQLNGVGDRATETDIEKKHKHAEKKWEYEK